MEQIKGPENNLREAVIQMMMDEILERPYPDIPKIPFRQVCGTILDHPMMQEYFKSLWRVLEGQADVIEKARTLADDRGS